MEKTELQKYFEEKRKKEEREKKLEEYEKAMRKHNHEKAAKLKDELGL